MQGRGKQNRQRRPTRRTAKPNPSPFARLLVEPLESRQLLSAAPTITPISTQTINEDGFSIVTFTVADADTPLNQLQITAASGNTTLVPNAKLVLTDLGGGNWRLNSTPAANQSGASLITVSAFDGTATTQSQFTLNVTAVNDAPVVSVPSAQVAVQNLALAFKFSSGNAVTLSDVDEIAGVDERLTLTVSNGTLNLTTSGLSSATGVGTSSIVATGTIASLNAALQTLVFNPTTNFLGTSVLTVGLNDQAPSSPLQASGTVLIQVRSVPAMLADIRPGTMGSEIGQPLVVGNKLFFIADDGVHGYELWTSDGTAAGTAMVVDYKPGSGSGTVPTYGMFAIGNTVYFKGNNGTSGDELIKSDGTAAGTVMVKDLNPGSFSSSPQDFVNFNGTLYFSTTGGLCRSDGTAAGTVQVIGFPTLLSIQHLIVFNNEIYFSGTDSAHGNELWKTDGTVSGTVLVKDLYPGTSGVNPQTGVVFNGRLYFAGTTANGPTLFCTDGTDAGTIALATPYGVTRFAPDLLTVAGNTLFFRFDDPTHFRELWATDGTQAGTAMLKDLFPGTSASSPDNLTNVNGTLYFSASDDTHGRELFKSDGTTAGTVLASDVMSGSGSSGPEYFLANGTDLYFQAITSSNGSELVKFSTTSGVTTFTDLNPGVPSSSPVPLAVIGNQLFLSATDATHGAELWALNITNAPPTTTGLADVNVAFGATSSTVNLAASFNDDRVSANGLYYSIVGNTNGSLLPNISLDLYTHVLMLNYNPGISGSATITVQAADELGATVQTTLHVTVAPSLPPTITPISNQTINEDGTSTVTFTVADPDTPLDQVQITRSSGNTTLVPFGNFWFVDQGGGNWQLTLTPAADQNGSSLITLSVFDGTTTTQSQFTLNVTPVNDAPSFTKGVNQTIVNSAGAQTIANWATNVSAGPNESGQTATFHTSGDNPSLFSVQPTIAADGTLSYTPSGVNGTATVSVYVQDDGGTAGSGVDKSLTQTFTIQLMAPTIGPGTLDPTFGTGGLAALNSTLGSIDIARDIAQQADGKFVVVGTMSNAAFWGGAVARFNSNGSLDTTFGTGGVARLNVSSFLGIFSAVEIQSDGKIIVGGFDSGLVYVTRFNSDGSLDTTFGTNGIFSNALGGSGGSSDDSIGMALQNDGTIVLSRHLNPGSSERIAVARVTSGGALDTTFNGVGFANLTINSGFAQNVPYDVAVQGDGKIVVVGKTSKSGSASGFFAARFNTNGTLDTTFGGGLGYVVIGVSSPQTDKAYRVAIQGDGKILLAGRCTGELGLVRLNANGTLDTSFNGTGIVTTPFANVDGAFAMVLQSDGKIVLGGSGGTSISVYDFILARYNTNGSLDTTFGDGGTKTFAVGPNTDAIYGLLVQSDGKLVAAGGSFLGPATGGDFTLARFNADASLDTSFGTGGVSTLNVGLMSATARAVVSSADGSMLVGGYLQQGPTTLSLTSPDQYAAVWRLKADGTLDTSFGTNGYFISTSIALTDVATILVQSDGRIIVVGNNNTRIARLSANGAIDTTYGTAGYLTLPTNVFVLNGVLQSDGKLLLSGRYTPNLGDFAVIRYQTDGTLDTSFGTGGMATGDWLGSTDSPYSIALQTDGKIVIAGDAYNGSNYDFGVARLNANGTLDTTFNGTGKFTKAIGTGTDSARAVAIQTDGKIVVGGYYITTGSTTVGALMRLTSGGTLDSSFGTGGIITGALTTTSERVGSILLPGDGTILAIGSSFSSGNKITVARYLAGGTLDTSFGVGGAVMTDVSPSTEFGFGSALQADGKLLVAGYDFVTSPAPTRYQGFVLRYTLQPYQSGPSSTPIADVSITNEQSTSAITFTVSHPTLPASSLTVSATSSNTSLIANANLALVNLSNGNWTIQATPTAGTAGTSLITVLVGDGTSSFSETFTVTVTNVAPKVVGVYAKGSAWNSAFNTYLANNGWGDATLGYLLSNGANQLKTLSWTNVNTISLQFSEAVTIGQNDLSVIGASNGPAIPAFSGFSWDSAAKVATWTFASALPRDKYLLHLGNVVIDGLAAALDGEWTDSTSSVSGNGTAGGDFNFRFNVLPNDNDGSNTVTLGEVLQARNRAGKGTLSTGYVYREDADGSGTIALPEVLQGRNRASTSITGLNEPIAPGSSPQLAAVAADPVMNADGEFVSPWTPLTLDELAPLVNEAKHRWEASGLVAGPIDWSRLHVAIADLGGILGLTDPDGLMRIDDDGAGWSWFVDATPGDDAEFAATDSPVELTAATDGPAAGRSDLLTTVMHELGIYLGFHDVPADQPPTVLMTETLGVGTRRIPTAPVIAPPAPIVAETPIAIETPVIVESPSHIESPIADVPSPATLPNIAIRAPIFVTSLPVITKVDSATTPSDGFRPEHAALALWLVSRSNGDDAWLAAELGSGTRTTPKSGRPVDFFAAWGRA